MYAILMLTMIGQGPDAPERISRTVFMPPTQVTPSYTAAVYAPYKPEKKKSMNQQLDELLREFDKSKNAAHVYKPGSGVAVRIRGR